MSGTLDKRIVEMAFENAGFEKNVSTSMSTIDKLKKSLNFDGVGKGFANITAAANKVTLGGIADGVDQLSNRFSTLGVMAMTVIANITNAALNAGKRIASALVIAPISGGFREYETQLNAVQTILANTQKEGTNLQTVNAALDELNDYSDKTIYNFGQMAKNIGTFTAAGVKLDTSVAAIKGIANLAALSGSSAEQASMGMYQLSQALASGTVRLMDWNSVNAAGMGGEVFRDSLMETARVHGVAIDDIVKKEGSFRESLSRGWLTSEILTETLSKFTGDLTADQLKSMGYTEDQIAGIVKLAQTAQDAATKVKTFSQLFGTLKEAAESGWAQTWRTIIGDFEEARTFMTELDSVFGGMIKGSAEARNKLVSDWAALGGRKILLEGVMQAITNLRLAMKPIGEAFRQIFPPMTWKNLLDITKAFRDLMKTFEISAETGEKIKRIFAGLFALLDIGRMAVVAIVKAFGGMASGLEGPLVSFTDFLVKVADFIVGLRESIKTTDAFTKGIEKVIQFLKPLGDLLKSIFGYIAEGLAAFGGIKLDGLSEFLGNVQGKLEPLQGITTLTMKLVGVIMTLVSKLAPTLSKLGSLASEGIGSFLDGISGALTEFEPERLFDILNSGLMAGLLLAVRDFIKKGSGVFSGITEVLDGVRGSLIAWQQNLKADALLKIAAALAILAVSLLLIASIDPKKLTGSMAAMTVMFAELATSLGVLEKVSSASSPLALAAMGLALIGISVAILLLASALKTLSQIKSTSLIKGILAIGIIVGVLKVAADSLSGSSAKMISGALALIVFSVAIRLLGKAVEALGNVETETLTKGLLAVGAIMAELALFMKTTDLGGMGMTKAVGILILAAAINVIGLAIESLGELDPNALLRGLAAIGGVLLALGLFVSVIGAAPTLLLTAAGILVISASLWILADVMKTLGGLSWEDIGKGLTVIAAALTMFGLAAYAIPPTIAVQAVGILIMAAALVILAKALDQMGGMSWDEIGRGLAVLAGSLLILALAMMAMQTSIGGAFAILIAAAALMALAPALKILGGMTWDEIGRGLVALAGALAVLGIAAALLTPVIPSLLGLGAGMLLIGAAALLAGAGILALSMGLAALATTGAVGAAALVTILTSIVSLIPMLVKTLGRALLALIDVLVEGAPKLLEGVVVLLNILLDGLIEIIPKVVEVVTELITQLVTAVAEKAPLLTEAGYSILMNFLTGIRDNIGPIVEVAGQIITNFMTAMSEQLPLLATSAWEFIISYIDAIKMAVSENLPTLMVAVTELGWAIVQGVVDGIFASRQSAIDAILGIGQSLIDGFKGLLGIKSPSTVFLAIAKDIIAGLINGLKNGLVALRIAMWQIVTSMIGALKSYTSKMIQAGKDLIAGLKKGIEASLKDIIAAAKKLAQGVLDAIKNIFKIKSPSRVMMEVGGYVGEGLGIGIKNSTADVIKSANRLGDDTIGAFQSALSGLGDVVNADMSIEPVVRPIVDLTEVQKGKKLIASMVGKTPLTAAITGIKVPVIAPAQTAVEQTPQQDGVTPQGGLTFVQNNYSPKELSTADIYRATRNQISQFKRLAGAL